MKRLPETVVGGALTGRRMAELKAHFLARSLIELQTLRDQLGEGEPGESFGRAALLLLHRMRGTALTFGLRSLAGRTQTLRSSLRGGASGSAARRGLEAMNTELRELIKTTAAARAAG